MSQSPPALASDGVPGHVHTTFKLFSKLMAAAQQPLPHQTGDGTYLALREHSNGVVEHCVEEAIGALKDIRHLGVHDLRSLVEIQKQKVTGELTDDKEYLMEGLIKVSFLQERARIGHHY